MNVRDIFNNDDNDGDNYNDKELFEEESNPEESEPEELESEEADEVTRTKSGRIIKPPSKLNLNQCHLQMQSYERNEYSIETGKVIAKKYYWIQSQMQLPACSNVWIKERIKKIWKRWL
jgi:hypothetical protein